MNYILSKSDFTAPFLFTEGTSSGIRKIAGKVAKDISLITGFCPEQGDIGEKLLGRLTEVTDNGRKAVNNTTTRVISGIIAGDVSESAALKKLQNKGIIGASLCEKRECFEYKFMEDAENATYYLLIAGSDRLGTVYGLFEISRKLGVSPYVDWALLVPEKKAEAVIPGENVYSKEPSIKYRGFFINDEWPAFGNWATSHFGGVNAKMYDHVFELLLRMNGNYMWPAMWASCFACDGPGLASAELADEYGIYMGMSHHEPCLRHGEEYKHLRGPESIYGDAWSFLTNREGITRFWEDGLKRNGHLRNVITVGMRGEADSTILSENSTLKDNIDLLRDVIRTQNRLIRENVNKDLKKVPRMLALYKEVEPFFYGDENTEGLISFDELEDVILMLCEDNHGYLRTVPDREMRRHPGGYGMYYHFDYHGSPVSYEWTDCTYLPVVHNEMTQAYESGIRELWIVNVGDLGLQEMPLKYFMDLAYDYETYGSDPKITTDEYLAGWTKENFGRATKRTAELASLIERFSRINHSARPEHLNEGTYVTTGMKKAEKTYREINEILKGIEEIRSEIKACDNGSIYGAFVEMVYYNVAASLNLHKMWIYTSANNCMARCGATLFSEAARKLADEAIRKDDELKEELHTVNNGMFYGFGLASHIGFKGWNDEEAQYPILYARRVMPGQRIVIGTLRNFAYTEGGDWSKKPVKTNVGEMIFAALAGSESTEYTIFGQTRLLTPERPFEVIEMKEKGEFDITYGNRSIKLIVSEKRDGVIIDAGDFAKKSDDSECKGSANDQVKAGYRVLKNIGPDTSGVKVYPYIEPYTDIENAPWVEYEFDLRKGGMRELVFETLPDNPMFRDGRFEICYSVNGARPKVCHILEEDYRIGPGRGQWADDVIRQYHSFKAYEELREGKNTLRFIARSANVVLLKIRVED